MGRERVIYNRTSEYVIKQAVDKSGGVMVALRLPPGAADVLSLEGGQPPEDLHITLAYLGKASEFTPEKLGTLHDIIASIAKTSDPVETTVTGYDVFAETDDGPCLYAAIEKTPSLDSLQETVVEAVSSYGMPPKGRGAVNGTYIPHVTLAYRESAPPPEKPPLTDLSLGWLTVTLGGTEAQFRLGDVEKWAGAIGATPELKRPEDEAPDHFAKDEGEGHWVTINGTHVLIGGDGNIKAGPSHLVGTKPDAGTMPSGSPKQGLPHVPRAEQDAAGAALKPKPSKPHMTLDEKMQQVIPGTTETYGQRADRERATEAGYKAQHEKIVTDSLGQEGFKPDGKMATMFKDRLRSDWEHSSNAPLPTLLEAEVARQFGGQVFVPQMGGEYGNKVVGGSLQSPDATVEGNWKEFEERLWHGDKLSSEDRTKFQQAAAAYAKGQYSATQAQLAQEPGDTVTLYRGMKQQSKGVKIGDSADFSVDALTSFSTSRDNAASFAQDKGDYILEVKVPKSAIFSRFDTGFGNLGEKETLVLGGKQPRWSGNVIHVQAEKKTYLSVPKVHAWDLKPLRDVVIKDVGGPATTLDLQGGGLLAPEQGMFRKPRHHEEKVDPRTSGLGIVTPGWGGYPRPRLATPKVKDGMGGGQGQGQGLAVATAPEWTKKEFDESEHPRADDGKWTSGGGSARWTRPGKPPEFFELSRHHEAERAGWEATGDVTESGNVIYKHPRRENERLFVGPDMWRHYKEGTVLGGGKIDDDSMRTYIGDLKIGPAPALRDAMEDPDRWTTASATEWGRWEAKSSMGLTDDESSFISVQQGDGPPFKVGAEQFSEGGHYSPGSGEMVVYLDNHKERVLIGGMLAHEVQHSKFRAVMQEYEGEIRKRGEIWEQIAAEKSPREADKEMYVNGVTSDRLTPKYAKMFPLYSAMKSSPIISSENLFQGQGEGPDARKAALVDSGCRVSAYACSYWKEWAKGTVKTDQAINETLAEVARHHYESGNSSAFREGMVVPQEWVDLHKTFIDHYERIRTLGAKF